jgi:MFS transporter, AAHS family, 4-hydroxybenzoate transporter
VAQAQTVDLGDILDRQKFSAFHVKLLIFAALVMLADGYDIGAAAYAGPALVKDWGISRAQLGPMFAAGLFAGLFGPPLIGYLADHFGRKRLIVAGALFFGIFTLASVWAQNIQQLIILRFIAGLGISGVLAVVVALVNEFSPRRLRATFITIMFSGVTFGGGLPGLIANRYMAEYGWQILFWVGGLVPIIVAIGLIFVLPESPKFLALQPRYRARLAKLVHTIAPGVAVGPDTNFVVRGEENRRRFSLGALFAGKLAILTPLFWITNACNLMVFYFVNSWVPTILPAAGGTVATAALATTLFQFSGTLGGWVVMRPLDKFGFIPVPILFALSIPIIAAIGLTGLPLGWMVGLIAASGFCLLGLQFGNIALESTIYPTYIRSWGIGSQFAAGRVGSVIGPVVGGVLIGMDLPMEKLFFFAAIPPIIGLIAAIAITPIYRANFHATGRATGPGGELSRARPSGD